MKSLLISIILTLTTTICAKEVTANLIAECKIEGLEVTIFSASDDNLYLAINSFDYLIDYKTDGQNITFGNENIALKLPVEEEKQHLGTLYFKTETNILSIENFSCYYYGISILPFPSGGPDAVAPMGGGVTVGNGPKELILLDPAQWDLKQLPFKINPDLTIIDIQNADLIFPKWK